MEETKPIDNIRSTTWRYIGTRYLPYVILCICACGALFYFFPNPFTLTVILIIVPGGYKFIYAKVEKEFAEEFAKSIGFSYTSSASLDSVTGKLFKTGRSQALCDVLSGTYQNMATRIFTFRFITGSGKSSHTNMYTVFETTVVGNTPDILLYSNSQPSAVFDWFKGDETVKLEGDFNKYFELRVPKGYEQEGYQIFTPDVMADLIDRARNFNFEFFGDKLYIYATKIITKREDLESALSLSEYLAGLFKKNTEAVDVPDSGQNETSPNTP